MTYFIAEVSSNHSKDLERCFAFIDSAAKIGCDAIKFQLFRVDRLFAPEILEKSETHRNRKEWELPLDFLPLISNYCIERKIDFGCTPFYLEAVDQLEPYVKFFKIASYELLWDALLAKCAATNKPVILSTGMANLYEIKHAVEVLKKNKCKKITLLHCTSSYPTPYQEANLSAIKTIGLATTNQEVGWSDHTVNPGVIHRAIHRWGAGVVEFHLDLDGKGEEYKTGHCWLPEQISSVISQVREGVESDGNGIKVPVESELKDRDWRADPEDGLRPLKIIRDKFD
jgi:sialic acid synthase SpsE